jgi:hypothetical protein
MKRFLLFLALPVILSAQTHSFTDKEGRTISARPISKSPDSVKVRMTDGRDYDIPLERLSDADAEFVKGWNPPKFKIRIIRDRVEGVQGGGSGSDNLNAYRFLIEGEPSGMYLNLKAGEKDRAIAALKRFAVVAERFKNDELPSGFRAEMALSSLDTKSQSAFFVASFKGKPVLRGGCVEQMQDGISVEIAPYLIEFLNTFRPDVEIGNLNRLKQKAL